MQHVSIHLLTLIAFMLMMAVPIAAYPQDDDGKDDVLQQQFDSLLATIKIDTPDSTKARIYYLISSQSENVDTTLKYAMRSLRHCTEDDTTLLAKNNVNVGWAYLMNCDYTAAHKYLFKGVNYLIQSNDSALLPTAFIIISNLYDRENMNDSTTYYLNRALDISIRIHDTTLMSQCYVTLGDISFNKRFNQSAENYYRKAMQLATEQGDLNQKAVCLQWLGNIYIQYGDSIHDGQNLYTARNYFLNSIAVHEQSKSDNPLHIFNKYDTYGDLADAYIKIANLTGDRKYADSCLHYYKISSSYLLQHGYYYSYIDQSRSYVQYLMYMKRYRDAEQFLHQIEQYFDTETTEGFLREHHTMLKNVYLHLGDYRKAYENLELQLHYTTIVTNDSAMTALANAQTAQAMIVQLLKQENSERIHAEQQRRMNTINISLLIGLILAAALVIAIVRSLRIKKKTNAELLSKNEQLNSQKSEIEAQRDEIEAQKNIITHQWQDVETANQKIIESINYAQRIQKAAIPPKKQIDAIFDDYFIYYRPRNIVSGDFYFAVQCGRYSVIITADCTGHGIPGAFLSMLGISALKEYMTTEDDAQNPGSVLDKIKSFIISTLNDDADDHLSDGMDMTVCCIDQQNMTMQYAIANQTATIIRNGSPIKLRGDRMPIGKSIIAHNQNFKTLTLPLQDGDMLYMYSDGIQDQMRTVNGERTRFSSQRLQSTLADISPHPTDQQLVTIQHIISEWQGDALQMDDMTLIGIRIKQSAPKQ